RGPSTRLRRNFAGTAVGAASARRKIAEEPCSPAVSQPRFFRDFSAAPGEISLALTLAALFEIIRADNEAGDIVTLVGRDGLVGNPEAVAQRLGQGLLLFLVLRGFRWIAPVHRKPAATQRERLEIGPHGLRLAVLCVLHAELIGLETSCLAPEGDIQNLVGDEAHGDVFPARIGR